MWRPLTIAVFAWLSLFASAHACLGTNLHRGVVFDEIPWDAPEDGIVLRVEFDRADVRRLSGPHPTDPAREWLLMQKVGVEARVLEVVRGAFDQPTVRVAIGGSSCDSPFIFGRRGLIVGALVTPAEGQARYDANQPYPQLRLTWEFTETVFVPLEETRDDRELRHAGLSAVANGPFIGGDFDGDGRTDTARFFEDRDGVLHIGVRRGARRYDQIERIWGGDISALPRFTIRTAPPGLYRTDCEAYGPDCGGAPESVTLTHEGIIVEGLEDGSRTLYYWADGEFKNVSILRDARQR